MDHLVSVPEAAKQLACAEASVRKWLTLNRLRRIKVGRLTRIKQKDVDAVIRGGLLSSGKES
jgi:excisionase family DNA binding protein